MRIIRSYGPGKGYHALILQKAEETWQEVLPKVNKLYPTFDQDFPVSTNVRLKSTGGRVRFKRGQRKGEMELNEKLLATNMELVRMVFIHELAHLIQMQKRGYSNHGDEFKEIMESLGCAATHYMPKGLNPRQGSKPKTEYIYHCKEGCEHKITIRKHNEIMKRGATYTCKRTRLPIRFKEYRKPQPQMIGA